MNLYVLRDELACSCIKPDKGPGVGEPSFDSDEETEHTSFVEATEHTHCYTWQSFAGIHQRSTEEGGSLIRREKQLMSTFKCTRMKDADFDGLSEAPWQY